tara:strand:- start:2403 stop:3065 length:663 start_codon:yes stop_codon:yes gene_type:complete
MIPGLNPVPTDGTAAQVKGKNGALGKDEFMKLLIAQLQAQDPNSPMDAQDFSAQMAQFSSVEQMFNVNSNLENLQKSQNAMMNNSAVNLIGKAIDAPGNGATLKSGKTTTFSYSLPEDANQVVIDIFDSTGIKVASLTENAQKQGINSVIWSGLNDKGKPFPEGEYTFEVHAFDQEGDEMLAKLFADGIVTEVTFEDGVSYAIANGNKIPTADINRVGLN